MGIVNLTILLSVIGATSGTVKEKEGMAMQCAIGKFVLAQPLPKKILT
jgi:hypothetical protein